jgi:hypothetical protein
MPGKVNPVIPEVVNQVAYEVIGNDVTISFAAEAGQLELNAMEPVIAYNLFRSIDMLCRACRILAEKCIDGITANRERCRRMVENSIMIESEGITESVSAWRTEVPPKIIQSLGLEKVMFEAADPDVFAWYVKNYGPEINLFVDHSQIVQLECLRSGIWGTKSLWGRVVTYKDL